jgi:CHAT domain-containing protein/tetratricopeptide (TPR) repeat protein
MRTKTQKPAFFIIVVVMCSAFVKVTQASPYTDYGEFLAQSNYPAALEVARKIIKRPNLILSITKDKDYLMNVRLMGLRALGYYAEFIGLEPGMTEEADRYYREALEYAGDKASLEATVHYAMAIFQSKASSPGLAIPLMSKATEIFETRHDTYSVIAAYIGWSALYADMGEQILSDHFEKKWMDRADAYFVLGRRPKDEEKWLIYYDALKDYAAGLSNPSDVNKLNQIWETMSAVNETYSEDRGSHYLSGARLFARVGEDQIATELLEKAVQAGENLESQFALATKTPKIDLYMKLYRKQWKADVVCTRAQVEHEIGMDDRALASVRACEQEWDSSGIDMGAGSRITLGAIYEASNDHSNALRSYNLSIQSTEGMRSSFNISDRAGFFTNPVIQTPYWGLIRINAKKALQSDSIEDFHAVLQAKERIRARQFGELISSTEISNEVLTEIQQGLDADTVVLDLVLTDKEIVLTIFSRDERVVALVPYDRGEFRKKILAIARLLSDPNSDSGMLGTELHRVSQTILGPALPLIVGKQQLIVITDGVLNLVPFELWSIGTTEYEPLVNVTSVRYVPALRSLSKKALGEGGNSEGLFALGDPIYPDPKMIAGLPLSEIEEATRGADFQSYFAPLPETRTEVESISKLFPGQPRALLFGERALESIVKGTDLSQYRYVHFATHGILGGEVPGIGEPALVLGEEPNEDGFLKASEAEQLKLNAQLTTLSACNTGSGNFVQGEGVMGLSRAFLLAGSESVLVSLWPVASEATEDLMLRFYKYMQNGERPQVALRHAKIDIKGEYSHPFFWAPFILIGQH